MDGAAMVLGELDLQYQGKSVILAYAGGDPPASFSALRLVVQIGFVPRADRHEQLLTLQCHL
jgi:hypothetical protein